MVEKWQVCDSTGYQIKHDGLMNGFWGLFKRLRDKIFRAQAKLAVSTTATGENEATQETAPVTTPTEKNKAMADYNQAAIRVLDHEGGYSNNRYDKGNYVCSTTGGWVSGVYPFSCSSGQPVLIGTMRGIAAPVLASWLGRIPTVQEMKTLSKQTALAIYKKNYWDRMKGDLIQNQAVADILFDGCVNHGVTRGIKLMQKAVNVAQDGIMGPITLNAINTRDPRLVYERYKNERRAFYQQIVDNDPKQGTFLTGWMNRINSFIDFDVIKKGGTAGLAVLLIIALLTWKQ